MGITKIPFGWHEQEGKWKEPGAVPRGLACGCVCHECKQPLQTVHPKLIQKYFRHDKGGDCEGALESLAHKLGKDVLATHSAVFISKNEQFLYDKCEVETRRNGKQPDIYLINSVTGKCMVVEIFYSHRMEESTLKSFQDNGNQVLEIDISATRKVFPSLIEFERLILKEAPRKFLSLSEPVDFPQPISSREPIANLQGVGRWWAENWPLIVLAVVLLAYWLYHVFRPKPAMKKGE
jgi:hypothetical protein